MQFKWNSFIVYLTFFLYVINIFMLLDGFYNFNFLMDTYSISGMCMCVARAYQTISNIFAIINNCALNILISRVWIISYG